MGFVYCVAYGCKNKREKRVKKTSAERPQDVTFHALPKDPHRRDEWVASISRHRAHYKPLKSHRVCSNHFLASDYDDDGFRRVLKKTSVPSVFENKPGRRKKNGKHPRRTLVRHQLTDDCPTPLTSPLESHTDHIYHSSSKPNEKRVEALERKMSLVKKKKTLQIKIRGCTTKTKGCPEQDKHIKTMASTEGNIQHRPKKVLCVGFACVDFINVVQDYPKEDSDQWGLDYYWQRGGNATNNTTVLSLINVPCEFMGVLGNQGAEASWIKQDFDTFGIDTSHCVVKPTLCPVATSILSKTSGSRTIIAYKRDKPELSFSEFHEKIKGDFSSYSWVHFELCSNVADIDKMVDDIMSFNVNTAQTSDRVMVSVEVEKPELKDPESILLKADVIFISKDYAKYVGFKNPVAAVEGLYSLCKENAILICAWGDDGAAARYGDMTLTASALTDVNVIDSLGAGDTFVAGTIAVLRSKSFAGHNTWGRVKQKIVIEDALQFGCRIAGLKCTMYGYKGLSDYASELTLKL